MRITANPKQHTLTQYHAFQLAYDHFNRELFRGKLPQVIVTLQRAPKMSGYFWPKQFTSRGDGEVVAGELALNPNSFVGKTDEEILGTLAHEMAHVWQFALGKPGRSGYHNRQWAAEMKRIGLYPSSTGEPGGEETGDSMGHYIVAGGPFQAAYQRLADKGLRLNWQARPRRSIPDRVKFTCPDCGQNVWGKRTVALLCGRCSTVSVLVKQVVMRIEPVCEHPTLSNQV